MPQTSRQSTGSAACYHSCCSWWWWWWCHHCTGTNTVTAITTTMTTLWVKKVCQGVFVITFPAALSKKFAIKWLLKIPQHPKCVATLPCEILMSEKWHVLYTVAVLLKGKLTWVLTYGRQQQQFYIKPSYYNFCYYLLYEFWYSL